MKDERNKNPHAEAILAMNLWRHEYGAQRKGCMDWYESIHPARRQWCRELLDKMIAAPRDATRQ
jgi:hypothetical protein